ncbi:MAG: class I SAM-dependent methyltransferase, partial [Pirellulaceae bacterium]
MLSIGYHNGFINNFSKQNAENLDFPNHSSDYVLIKEALHHCPRPWLALHEAFRVCKKGVVFVEPCESLEYLKSPLSSIINLGGSFKRLLKSAIGVQDLQPLAPY